MVYEYAKGDSFYIWGDVQQGMALMATGLIKLFRSEVVLARSLLVKNFSTSLRNLQDI